MTEKTQPYGSKRFEDLARLLPQVVFETDRRGRVTFCNEAAFKMFGYTTEDFKRGLSSLDMLAGSMPAILQIVNCLVPREMIARSKHSLILGDSCIAGG